MGEKKPRPRRSFTPEFKAEIVELCQRGDRSVGRVAKNGGRCHSGTSCGPAGAHVDLTETAVWESLRKDDRDAGTGDGGLTRAGREELAQLRRENRRLREDIEILKRATASS